jgi:hypothetical protein
MSRHWPITLHQAIQVVLWDCPNRTASTDHISEQINTRRIYVQKDGGHVFPEQIILRAKNYPDLFDLVGRDTVTAR